MLKNSFTTKVHRRIVRFLALGCVVIGSVGHGLAAPQAKHVIIISVDAMGSAYLKPLLGEGSALPVPALSRVIREGAGTLNARTDADFTITLPNHVTMVTGRGVRGPNGHGWTKNTDPDPGETLATCKGSYVASAFDVAHDHGLRTGLWSGKSKFVLLARSYDAVHGQEDRTGADEGRDKIDYEKVAAGIAPSDLTDDFIREMRERPCHLALLHYQDPDAAGHHSGWSHDPQSAYLQAIKQVDVEIGRILDFIGSQATLTGKTVLLITADHGGYGKGHDDITNPLNFTVPFFAWGAGVAAGADLYALNPRLRKAPAAKVHPSYSGPQPWRDGDAANLSLKLLGLPSVPGSTIGMGKAMKLGKAQIAR